MNQILSQEEVESLLGGIDEGKVKTETAAAVEVDNAAIYDFSRQRAPLHLSLPALGIINKRFITLLRESLSTTTGTTVDISITSTNSKKIRGIQPFPFPPDQFEHLQDETLKGICPFSAGDTSDFFICGEALWWNRRE